MHPNDQLTRDDSPNDSRIPNLNAQSQVAEGVSEAEIAVTETKRGLRNTLRLSSLLPVWVPIIASVISLAVSLYTFFISTEPPDVLLIVPQEVRLAQVSSAHNWALIYIQTTFVSTGINGRAEVIPDMHVDVNNLARGETVSFQWREQGTFKFEPDPNTPGSGETYVHVSDALPLLVSPSNGQAPVAVFKGPDGWTFQTGTYQMTLVADRAVNGKSLSQTFKVAIGDSDMANWQGQGANMFFTFSVEK